MSTRIDPERTCNPLISLIFLAWVSIRDGSFRKLAWIHGHEHLGGTPPPVSGPPRVRVAVTNPSAK